METKRVRVPGGEVVAYIFGDGAETVVPLSGGPGLACDYMRESHKHYADEGFRVVVWDQLGTGQSDRPNDPSLWTLPRFVEEVETVRRTLNLGKIHIVGHSWGGILGLDYTLAHPDQVKRFVMSNIAASMPLVNLGLKQCRLALGIETAKMMSLRECEGTKSHPEYQAALTRLVYRHLCRTEMPDLMASLQDIGPAAVPMFGPHLFQCTGTLASWDRTADLHRVKTPVLLITGEHDYMLPEYVAIALNYLPNARLKLFRGCSHMPLFENPEGYHREVLGFLKDS